jgi:tRNA threonylcarbamoyladenosine biosynthesis protein TsaE
MSRVLQKGIRSFTLISRSPEDTLTIGKVIGEHLEPGNVIALVGELGSGKTCITQGIARGIHVPGDYQITSPTFTLINEYPGRIRLYHMDVYRLSGAGDLELLGYEDYFYGDGIVVVEWAEKIAGILPEGSLFIYLRYLDETSREIRIEGTEQTAERLFRALKEGGFQ